MRRFLFAVILVVAGATGAVAGPAEEADSAYQRGDYAQAMNLWRPLAAQGNARAQFSLGLSYELGHGVSQDTQEAAKWYRKAAEQGHVEAQFLLGVMYTQGQGVPQDAQAALKWFRKAAKQGDAEAQFRLSAMYRNGQGVPQDFIRAYMWSIVAGGSALSSHDGKTGKKNRSSVTSSMTAAQIEKAQEMARRCQKTKFKECD